MKLSFLLLCSLLGSFAFVAACGRVDDGSPPSTAWSTTDEQPHLLASAQPRRRTLTTHEITVLVERYQ